ncbi:hypothetical protein RsTz2092_09500 [Deferribacterales bacterium RsTz2092]|nr:hypothetical protein AGMMS49941_07200 [Deferribacterales bacterium]
MVTKFIFSTLRGLRLFVHYVRTDVLAVLALTALFVALHILFALGFGVAAFTEVATRSDNIRVYMDGTDSSLIDGARIMLEEKKIAIAIDYYDSKESKQLVLANAAGVNGADELPEEMFPTFFLLKLKDSKLDVEALEKLSAELANITGVESVSYGGEWARKLETARLAISVLMVVIAAIFAISATVIVHHTISVALYRYRRTIRIYSIVGGTRAFIVSPFVVTAATLGTVSAALSLVCYKIANWVILSNVSDALGLNVAVNIRYVEIFIALAFAISAISGFSSARKFHKAEQAGEI